MPSGFAEKLAIEPFENLPLRAEHTPTVAMLEWHHRDPFDRMLIAQAKSENLVVLAGQGARSLRRSGSGCGLALLW